jgi:hypothetical protein
VQFWHLAGRDGAIGEPLTCVNFLPGSRWIVCCLIMLAPVPGSRGSPLQERPGVIEINDDHMPVGR